MKNQLNLIQNSSTQKQYHREIIILFIKKNEIT